MAETFSGMQKKKRKLMEGLFAEKSPVVLLGIAKQNNYLTQVVALLMAVIECVFFLGYVRKFGFFPEGDANRIKRVSEIMYLVMAVYSGIMWWYLRNMLDKIEQHFRRHGAVLGVYYSFFLIYGTYLAVLYKQEKESGFVLILALICTFGVAMMHPVRLMVTSVVTYVVVEAIFILEDVFDFRFAMNVLEIIFFLNIIGLVKYYTICGFIETTEQLKKYSNILEWLSYRDELTKIGNRNALRKEWENYVGKTISVALFDVDNFKHYNDTYGHDVGDLVLQQVAAIVKELFGEECSFRLGGDEFLVVTALVDEEMRQKLQALHEEVHEISENGNRLGVSVSIGGIKATVKEPEDMLAITKKADEILYEVKGKGKDGFIYRDIV